MTPPRLAIALLPRKFRVRTLLIVPFVVQVVAAVGLVGWLSFRSGQKAVNSVASTLRSEIAFRIERELQGYFDSPHALNRLNAAAFVQGSINFVDAQNVSQFLQQVKISSYVDAIYCATSREGLFLGVTRLDGADDFQIMRRSETATGGRMTLYSVDSVGNRQYFVEAKGKYDPRIRPWYKAAVQAERPVWSPVYLDFTSGLPTITASQPVYGETDGQLLGVCAADVILPKDFRSFLVNLSIGKSGQAFVMDRSGAMLSSSTNEPLLLGSGDQSKLRQVTESTEPLVRETSRFLRQKFGGFDQIQRSLQTDFILNGKRQLVQVLPFDDNRGLDWLIVVVVPESDFMGQIHANTRNTIGLSVVALLVAIVIGILTSHWIAQPILRVARASEDMADGKLDQHVQSSRVREIARLANSFNSMASQLTQSFADLEANNEKLRLAEETYRSIFQNALEGIFQSTWDGQFITVNPAMARIYGYVSPDDMLQSITNIDTQIYVDANGRSEFKRQIEQYGEIQNATYQVYRKDGSVIWIEESTRAVKGNTGQLLYFEGIVEDVTQRKYEEERLKRLLEELKIEIDQKRLEQEVSKITESEYFKKLKDEVKRLKAARSQRSP